MDLPTFTLIHVVISVLGILSGLVVAGGMVASRMLGGWKAFFLLMTVLTSVTGFFFPFTQVSPPHIVGGLSLLLLAVALVALYGKRLAGGWRKVYVITAMASLYLNAFVLMVQLMVKTPTIAQVAPQGSAAFGLAHLVVLGLMGGLGWSALRNFRP